MGAVGSSASHTLRSFSREYSVSIFLLLSPELLHVMIIWMTPLVSCSCDNQQQVSTYIPRMTSITITPSLSPRRPHLWAHPTRPVLSLHLGIITLPFAGRTWACQTTKTGR